MKVSTADNIVSGLLISATVFDQMTVCGKPLNEKEKKALQVAFKCLEALPKIREEIADQKDFAFDCNGESDLGIALAIIDKYMEDITNV